MMGSMMERAGCGVYDRRTWSSASKSAREGRTEKDEGEILE